jgi:hypothetical protein
MPLNADLRTAAVSIALMISKPSVPGAAGVSTYIAKLVYISVLMCRYLLTMAVRGTVTPHGHSTLSLHTVTPHGHRRLDRHSGWVGAQGDGAAEH